VCFFPGRVETLLHIIRIIAPQIKFVIRIDSNILHSTAVTHTISAPYIIITVIVSTVQCNVKPSSRQSVCIIHVMITMTIKVPTIVKYDLFSSILRFDQKFLMRVAFAYNSVVYISRRQSCDNVFDPSSTAGPNCVSFPNVSITPLDRHIFRVIKSPTAS
jgi:hypothetical protein